MCKFFFTGMIDGNLQVEKHLVTAQLNKLLNTAAVMLCSANPYVCRLTFKIYSFTFNRLKKKSDYKFKYIGKVAEWLKATDCKVRFERTCVQETFYLAFILFSHAN